MKEKILYHGIPIVGRMPLFTFDNRQAVRDNLKTQTRRVVKTPVADDVSGFICDKNGNWWICNSDGKGSFGKCPYGIPGDVRCMCEPLMRGDVTGLAYYRDDYWGPLQSAAVVISLITGKPLPWRWKRNYLASIHMPTEAARTVCRTTDIRVEKLQEISEEDAIAEGVGHGFQMNAGWPDYQHIGDDGICTLTQDTAVMSFATLWDSINAKRGYGWDIPQMVWVNAFEKLEG